jgi:hypothetical protein
MDTHKRTRSDDYINERVNQPNKKQRIDILDVINQRDNFIKKKWKYLHLSEDYQQAINDAEKWLLENCEHKWERDTADYGPYERGPLVCAICGCEK